MPDDDLNPVLGIDLGTTFSAIARWDGRGPRPCRLKNGGAELQSVVYYDSSQADDPFLVGDIAYRRGLIDPDNMALGIKRHMDNANQGIAIGGKEFTPIELSAKILERLYADVASMYPKDSKFRGRGTVVTVPYYFKAHQCENTRKAAELAKISCLGILQEPIAASLSYAYQLMNANPTRDHEEKILVFDLGGGTFDLTLFRLIQTKQKLLFEVMASGGDDRLGGMDFDQCLMAVLVDMAGLTDDLLKLKDKSPQEYRKSMQKILAQTVETKKELSVSESAYVTVDNVIPPSKKTPAKHIDIKVTAADFEKSIQHYVDKIDGIIEALWAKANCGRGDVNRVVLVGGSSKIPRMRKLLAEVIGENKIYADNDPALCVAEGAALYAAYLDDASVFGRKIEITTRTCHALGVRLEEDAFGAVIAANRAAPCEHTQSFTNGEDGMEVLEVDVYQGSSASKKVDPSCRIGTVVVSDLPKRPKNTLDILITFKVSKEQKLKVLVKVAENKTGKTLVETEGNFTYA